MNELGGFSATEFFSETALISCFFRTISVLLLNGCFSLAFSSHSNFHTGLLLVEDLSTEFRNKVMVTLLCEAVPITVFQLSITYYIALLREAVIFDYVFILSTAKRCYVRLLSLRVFKALAPSVGHDLPVNIFA